MEQEKIRRSVEGKYFFYLEVNDPIRKNKLKKIM